MDDFKIFQSCVGELIERAANYIQVHSCSFVFVARRWAKDDNILGILAE